MPKFTNLELEAYLEEALAAELMSDIEAALRTDAALGERLAELIARRDAGVHSLGEIWRRHRLTCPSRQQLGNYLLGVMPPAEADYVKFHLDEVGCRQCQANLDDLNAQQAESGKAVQSRRSKYFQSSAGYLNRK